MKYRFILTYKPTDSETTATRTCFPLHGDDLSISIDRAEGEWYYTRNLDGKLVFTGGDYDWIMGQEFDGTFTLDIKESHDNGATFFDYFTGTFSRASLEIDQDNKQATLNGLKEGVEDLIKNGKNEDYDLMKLIPDSYAKEVQGQVPPALALLDEHSTKTKPSISDIFCDSAMQSGGYNEDTEIFWAKDKNMYVNPNGRLQQIVAEAKVIVRNNSFSHLGGLYTGIVGYATLSQHGTPQNPDVDYYINSTVGELRNQGNFILELSLYHHNPPSSIEAFIAISLGGTVVAYYSIGNMGSDYPERYWFSPMYIKVSGTQYSIFDTIEIKFHYIYSSLLTQSAEGVQENILDTGDYYQGIAPFQGSGLTIMPTIRTVEQPNGHRLLPGTGEQGTTPQYYAPPTDNDGWIPLAEDNWDYASMWYKIVPSVANGLLDPAKFGSFRWTRCWTIGTCIQFLLKRITNDKVVFSESTDYSQFLYGNPNPVEGHEPFQWLVTQKSNVMHPAATGAARCIVRLDWFLELLRNAFNCYYWFERRNDGRYDFRIEHVEYFRRGGTYTQNTQDDPPLDLTRLKPVRNFLRNGQPAKRYADQTNKYTFDLDGMVEKYTYSWQGDGGSDDFKGNPMYFRAGWIEKGSSEDHQVDNIFADLGWLMLNAGTDTASSKNYDGLFIFGGYRADGTLNWRENTAPALRYPPLASGSHIVALYDIWLTAPEGDVINVTLRNTDTMTDETITSITSTGRPQALSLMVDELLIGGSWVLFIDFGNSWQQVVVHRVHALTGNVYYVPNVDNLLRDDDSKLQNGVLAWPWLQCEYLHYDIPAAKWTYKKDEYTDNPDLVWESDGTIKMVKKQNLAVVPVPDASTEDAIIGIMGVRTGLGIGIIDNAKINLSSRNAEMTIIYDINPQNQ